MLYLWDMKKLTRAQYRKIVRRRRNSSGDIQSAYDLNEVGGFAADRKIKR